MAMQLDRGRLDKFGGQRFVNEVTEKGIYNDGDGLRLEVGKGGGESKSWVHRYMSPTLKRERYMGLGPAKDVTLADARAKLRENRILLRRGIDPMVQADADEQKRREELARQDTFRQVAEQWFRNNEGDWEPATVLVHRHRLEKHIYPFVDDVTGSKCADLPIQKFDMRPADSRATTLVENLIRPFHRKQRNTFDKLQQDMAGILATAIAKRYFLGENAASMRKDSPLRVLFGNSKYKPKPLDHLPYEQIPEFMAKLRARIANANTLRAGSSDPRCQVCASPHINEINAAREAGATLDHLAARFGMHRATIYRHLRGHSDRTGMPTKIRAPVGAFALQCIVLIPGRKMELKRAEWNDLQEIDGVRCLVWPAERDSGRQGHKVGKKTGKAYVIPLSTQAAAVIDSMKKWQTASGIKSKYIFPGGQGGGNPSTHLGHSTVNKYLNVSLGYPHITVHGFRHTFGNWADANDYPDTNSEIVLGHIVGGKTRNSYKDDIKRLRKNRDMLQHYANYCDGGAPLPSQETGSNLANFMKEKAARRA
jgi:integrase